LAFIICGGNRKRRRTFFRSSVTPLQHSPSARASFWIGRERPDYDLSFLRGWTVDAALAWLERFPGVGQKVASATLNASTLGMRVFIVDSHVHRILLRFGLIGPQASARAGRDAVTAAAAELDADDLLELFALVKRLGQTLCRPFAADCRSCPLATRCQKKVGLGVPVPAGSQGGQGEYRRAGRAKSRLTTLSPQAFRVGRVVPRGAAAGFPSESRFDGSPSAAERQAGACDPPNLIRFTPA
jgi:hypothetical protein